VRSVTGVLPMAVAAREEGLTELYVPEPNAAEATCHEQITVCDLTGVGVQNTAITLLANRKAREREFQLEIEV
jgi:ornithine cyclodeaminase/alanine dehydrogenase-like protein (mu-crystallin family)